MGEWFTFEKGVTKSGGGEGFADVWKKGFFAWEYKKKKRNLDDALGQLVRYAAALENPPLQVACDADRLVIRTAWTNAVPKSYELKLDDLADPRRLDILRSVFFDPEKWRPKETRTSFCLPTPAPAAHPALLPLRPIPPVPRRAPSPSAPGCPAA